MLCPFLAAFLALATRISAATIQQVDNNNLARIDDSLPKLTWLDAIDRRFTTTTQLQGPPLDVNVYFLNIVEAMATYALLNFTADVTPVIVGSPDVMIVPRGLTPGGTIEARFLVWGLYAGVRGFILYEIFDTVELTLKWDGDVVGYIKILKPNARSTIGASNDTSGPMLHLTSIPSTPARMNETDVIDASLQIPENPAISHLSVQFTGFGRPLTRDEVIIAILRTILFMAPNDSDHTVQPLQVSAPAPYDANLRIRPLHPPSAPSAEPFTYAMAMRGLLAITKTALRHGRWSEASFNVLVNGMAIGQGAILKGRR